MFEALLTRWRDLLLRKLDIREGEFKRVWLMQLHVFLLILCLWIIKPVVNAQFLSRVGIEKLPSAFLMVALTALVVSISYSRWLTRLSLGKIMVRTYLVSIISLLAFAMLMQFHLFQDWMSYLFYIGVALFGLITTSQFWLLGNLVFNSLEAKRLFGFIGAGAIAGGILGGYTTSTLAPRMDSENLLFIAVGLLITSMVVNQRIWVTFVPAFSQSIQIRQTKTLHEYPFRLIRNSKHLTFLALIIGISVVVDKLVEFQFSSIASASISDPGRLTAFFGFWFSTSNVVSLVIQLFITQRLIAFLGVGRSLFVFPGVLFAGAAAVLYTPVLWAGTALKLIDISLKQSINKAATELLILPIPMAIKGQAKTYIDVFVDTTATGVGGILLIFIVNGLHLSVRAVCIMILALIGLWVYFAVRARKEYVRTFQAKLNHSSKLSKRKDLPLWNADVVNGIRRTLHTGSTQQILFLLARIEESRDHLLMPDAIPLLTHDSARVRQAVLRCLYYHTDHTITTHVEPLLKDPDDEVRSRAFSCLLAHTRQDRVRFINDYLANDDPAISGAALVGLATEARDNLQLQNMFRLEERIQEKINSAKQLAKPEDQQATKTMIMRAIGYGKVKAYYPLLTSYLEDKDPEVVKQALLAAGSSQEPSYIMTLLTFLAHKSTRAIAKKAIAKYEPSEILPTLAEVSMGKKINKDILIHLPSLAKTMDTQQAINFLIELLQHGDVPVQRESLGVLQTMKIKFPHLTISGKRIFPVLTERAGLYRDTLALRFAAEQIKATSGIDPKINLARQKLIHLLESKLDNLLEQIFSLLSLLYSPASIQPLFKDLRSKDPNSRINAVEWLDNILAPAAKHIVLPIAETLIQDTLSDNVLSRLERKVPTAFACCETILLSDDDQLKLAVLELIAVLDQPVFAPLVKIAAIDNHRSVRMLGEQLLMNGGLKHDA